MITAYQEERKDINISHIESFVKNLNLENLLDEKSNFNTEIDSNLVGFIEIESADIREPIYYGPVTEEKLRNGVSLIHEGDNLDMQNVAIAGHRVEGIGIRFNYLDQVKNGDIINVVNHHKDRAFIITEIFEVNPSEVEVLHQTLSNPQELTLITCEAYNPETLLFEKRLIIKAEIIN